MECSAYTLTLVDLHSEILNKKYSQKPQLSATHEVVSCRLLFYPGDTHESSFQDIKRPFIM